MEVIAKVDGYHPASGLHLIAGETYVITREQFSDSVFEKKKIKSSAAKAEGGE